MPKSAEFWFRNFLNQDATKTSFNIYPPRANKISIFHFSFCPKRTKTKITLYHYFGLFFLTYVCGNLTYRIQSTKNEFLIRKNYNAKTRREQSIKIHEPSFELNFQFTNKLENEILSERISTRKLPRIKNLVKLKAFEFSRPSLIYILTLYAW